MAKLVKKSFDLIIFLSRMENNNPNHYRKESLVHSQNLDFGL